MRNQLLNLSNRAKTRLLHAVTPWLFMLPVLLLLGVLIVYPAVGSFYFSLTQWSGGATDPVFVGFENYVRLFDSGTRQGHYFLIAAKNTIIWTVIFVTIPVLIGLLLAVMLNANVRGENFFKTAFYFPMVLSFVVLGLVWRWIFTLNGPLNAALDGIGLGFLTQNWLGDPRLAIYSVITAASWRHISYCMVIYLAALKSVPKELIESSKIDGANGRQAFFHVVLPMLRPATVVIVTTSIISSFKIFDVVFAMTRGGPFGSSDVLSSRMYQDAFWNRQLGHASSIAVVIFLAVAILALPYIRRMTSTETEY